MFRSKHSKSRKAARQRNQLYHTAHEDRAYQSYHQSRKSSSGTNQTACLEQPPQTSLSGGRFLRWSSQAKSRAAQQATLSEFQIRYPSVCAGKPSAANQSSQQHPKQQVSSQQQATSSQQFAANNFNQQHHQQLNLNSEQQDSTNQQFDQNRQSSGNMSMEYQRQMHMNAASAAQKLCLSEISRPSSELSRTSLLGRPLKVETHNRDLRFRKKQNMMYNFLERPRGWRAALYHFSL